MRMCSDDCDHSILQKTGYRVEDHGNIGWILDVPCCKICALSESFVASLK